MFGLFNKKHGIVEQPVHGCSEAHGAPDQDYLEGLSQVTSDSAKFWFDMAHDLGTLPESGKMDIRPNGRFGIPPYRRTLPKGMMSPTEVLYEAGTQEFHRRV